MRIPRVVVAGASACVLTTTMLPLAHAAEEETAGNNLSVPVLWSEAGYAPAFSEPVIEQFTGLVRDGYVVARDTTSEPCKGAVQKDPGNIWRADVALKEGGSISVVDWGDNLESMDPNLSRAYTRVEVGLYSALETAAKGYDMCWIEGRGQNEVWGAQVEQGQLGWSPITSDRLEAMVYTAGARLTIQRIVPDRNYTWNATTHQWQGTGADAPYYSGAIHEGAADGPGSFGSEVTVSGRLSYGYLWDARSVPQGEYRLTFSLDGPTGDFPGSGTNMANASILASEESEPSEEVGILAEGQGNTAVMRGDLNLTYLDVTVGTRTDPIPTDDETPPPPPPNGGASGTDIPPAESPASPGMPPGTPGGADQGQGQDQNPGVEPASAAGLKAQTARIRARKAGTYKVGQTLLLTAKPIYTDAGVTVRWRARVADRNDCRVRVRDGRATVKLLQPGTCRVVAWAPAPSPDYSPFRWTRTYRAVQ